MLLSSQPIIYQPSDKIDKPQLAGVGTASVDGTRPVIRLCLRIKSHLFYKYSDTPHVNGPGVVQSIPACLTAPTDEIIIEPALNKPVYYTFNSRNINSGFAALPGAKFLKAGKQPSLKLEKKIKV